MSDNNEAQRLSATFWSELSAAPWRYDLFAMLRRLDAQGGHAFPLGRAPQPRHEPLRLGQQPSLAFAPSTLAEVRQRDDSPLYDVSILSFGLFGPGGPLPLHLTEYARDRLFNQQDGSLVAFANLFHHRLTLLFYRAWANAQPVVSLDRPDTGSFERYLASLTGAGLPAQMAAPNRHAFFAAAGHLCRQIQDAEGLEKMLHHYFRLPVKIVENVTGWMRIAVREQARLKAGRGMPRVGESAFLGLAARSVQHKFRIELGPLPLKTYNQFLPGATGASELLNWLRRYVGIEFEWELRLLLASEEVKGIKVGNPARLGYSSWLGKQPRPAPRGDLTYSPEKVMGLSSANCTP
ncbi:type VI secretion system baseplate subunit TssG [Kalamiella sp. sgz302252]|uniref:type VI secretion system baseplate subunit TssG n=1 Tax=Pantoea sp. sgz302252 TaxID=3341827 RepID=UPI0036D39347